MLWSWRRVASAGTKETALGASVEVHGKNYDIDRDFEWRELITIEELAGIPLGRPGSLEYAVVGAALIFVVMKREDESLTWEEFLKTPPPKGDDESEAEPKAKPRPTKAKTEGG
jgi:hypothetical protein